MILIGFLVTPTSAQLSEQVPIGGGKGVSVSYITAEALRLYPPTRRVNRANRSGADEAIKAAADVEATQRDSENWVRTP